MAQELTIHLLDALAAEEKRVSLPILKHSARRRSGLRGLSRSALHGLRTFYAKRGALDKVMQVITSWASALSLTPLSSLLQLANSSTVAPPISPRSCCPHLAADGRRWSTSKALHSAPAS